VKSRAVLAVVVTIVLISGAIAANVIVRSNHAEARNGVPKHERTLTFRGRLASHGARTFRFKVARVSVADANLSWTDPHAELMAHLSHAGKSVGASSTSAASRHREITFAALAPGSYALRVVSVHGGTTFAVELRLSWALVANSASTRSTRTAGRRSTGSDAASTHEPEPSDDHSHGPAPSYATPPMWSAEFMTDGAYSSGFDVGLTTAIDQARAFDVIAAHPNTYSKYVGAMKAANPQLRLLAYVNGTFSSSKSPTEYPDSWYAHDASGKKIQAVGFGTYLMDPRNPAWRDEVISLCRSRISMSGYDGCFLDVMGTSGVDPASVTSLPVDPNTGAAWTKSNWLHATEAIAAAVKGALGARPVFGNGLGCGTNFFSSDAPTYGLLGPLQGGMAEAFVRPATSSVDYYKSESSWKADVDMLVAASAHGRDIVVTTKVWAPASQEQIDSWHRYALATFLLGYTPGLDFFSFRSDHSLSSPYPAWQPQVGVPTGPYSKIGGVYQRPFSNGRVLVNPTDSTITVRIEGLYHSLEVGSVDGTIVMPPHSAQILTRD
jgi:hypothetical protein